MRSIVSACIALTTLACFTLTSFAQSAGPNQNVLRVLIMDDKESVYLSVKDSYKITTVNPERLLVTGTRIAATVRSTKEGIQVGSKVFKMGGIRIRADGKSKIYVGGRLFRGDVEVLKKDNGRMMLINYIALDDYLYGVLYHEVSHRWPMDVLKAQAIAARTFAIYQARQNRLQPYDLRSDIYSQVYGGSTSERWSTTMAVNSTSGMILSYKGGILPSYYHATCSGHTEDAGNLWKVSIPPLAGVECNYCDRSPYLDWAKEISLFSLESKLRENGYKIGKITAINVISRNRSGRVDKMDIRDNAGVSVVLTGKDFRQLIGPNDLRSTKFDMSIKYGSLFIDGHGWGHGVGMCQWGAYGMALKGMKFDQILKFYYPGSEIISIDAIRGRP